MTIEYGTALSEMRLRRKGTAAYGLDSLERYQMRASQPAIQYALGAMQEVDSNYTRVSMEEGERVATQVQSNSARTVTIRIQGSVPLNTHIRRASDVDMLVINEGFFNYSHTGVQAATYAALPTFETPATQEMAAFRKECENILTSKYYAANVNTNNAKSVQVSGGSVVRKVDIVPANWYRGDEYQLSGLERNKEIQIFNKETFERPRNHPFKFMYEVELKDGVTQGGTKKAVRLLKNLKNDSTQNIDLSSYDITSVIWNMPNNHLNLSGAHDLTIVANTQAYLEYLANRQSYTMSLDTPDKSRKAIDTLEKFNNLQRLSREVDLLAQKIYGEAVTGLASMTSSPPSIGIVRQWLSQQQLAG